jgi:putative transposase
VETSCAQSHGFFRTTPIRLFLFISISVTGYITPKLEIPTVREARHLHMARRARVVLPGCSHHVTQRGNQHQDVFFTDLDRDMYLKLLKDHAERAGLRIEAYCLMTNHVHLIVNPEDRSSLAVGLGRAHNDYARWLHVRRRQSGHLWQNRFFSCPLDQSHWAEALRYVEMNPVRAGLVAQAWDWCWSSSKARVSGRDQLNLLHLGLRPEDCLGESWKSVLANGWKADALTKRIREATRTGRPLGGEHFLNKIESEFGICVRPRKRGPKPARACVGKTSLGVT